MLKQAIEHKLYMTGAQAFISLWDLKTVCEGQGDLAVKKLPPTAKLEDRDRVSETRAAKDLDPMISTARSVLAQELEDRFFTERPSNSHLVQCYMSEQLSMEVWAPSEWVSIAKALYARMLREAASIAEVGLHISPRKKQKTAAASSSGGLFRNLATTQTPPVDDAAKDFDAVSDEMQRWQTIDVAVMAEFFYEEGLLNEFALLYKLRNSFPLHYTLFKQVSSHLPHEANTGRGVITNTDLEGPGVGIYFIIETPDGPDYHRALVVIEEMRDYQSGPECCLAFGGAWLDLGTDLVPVFVAQDQGFSRFRGWRIGRKKVVKRCCLPDPCQSCRVRTKISAMTVASPSGSQQRKQLRRPLLRTHGEERHASESSAEAGVCRPSRPVPGGGMGAFHGVSRGRGRVCYVSVRWRLS